MFGYIGGKYKQAQWLREHCSPLRHTFDVYVEPFGGAFWHFLQNEEYFLDKEIYYNDQNVFNCNAMRCFIEPEFSKYIKGREQNNKALFHQYADNLNDLGTRREEVIARMPDFELAWQYLYKLAHSQSSIYSAGWFMPFDEYNKLTAVIDKINNPKYVRRLKRVKRFTCLDFEEIIRALDGPRTFYFVDPPYMETEHLYSFHEFGRSDHKRVVDLLKGAEGKSLLTYYRFPELEGWLPPEDYNWVEKKFASTVVTNNKAHGTTKSATNTEIAIAINYAMRLRELLSWSG